MNKTLIIVLVLVVVVLGGYFLLKGEEAQAPTDETSGMPIQNTETPETIVTEEENTETPALTEEAVITYTDSGYSPSPLTIKVGDTVVFKNESAQNMWIASAMHPSHMVYSGTSLSEHCPDEANMSFDACEGTLPGESWSFTFTKAGEWKYHDHLHPILFGTIVVE